MVRGWKNGGICISVYRVTGVFGSRYGEHMQEQQRFHGPSDLHLHSLRSDGTDFPADVMRSAFGHGVRTAALTDHDTTAGWREAADAARELGMTLLPGMELSTRRDGRSVHMLAYLFDPSNSGIIAETTRIRDDRLGRAERIVRNIARDYDLTWDDVLAQRSGDASIGRPHIADALVARGLVADRGEAFDGILHPRAGYTETLYSPDPIAAIKLIRAAGGVPVMAHPAPHGRSGMLAESALRELIEAGLAGFEIDHRENTEAGKVVLRRLVSEYDLIATGSSDSHGAGKPNIPGENTTSDENVRRIIGEASGTTPVYGGEFTALA